MNMEHLKSFLDSLRVVDGLAENTLESYNRDMEIFLQHLKKQNKNITSVSSRDLDVFIHQMTTTYSSSTVNRIISSLKRFFDFLQMENIIKSNPSIELEHRKQEILLPKFLSETMVSRLLEETAKDKSDFGVQFHAMLELLYATGLRVSELVCLKMSAIEKEFTSNSDNYRIKNYIKILGKGGKERIVPIAKNCVGVLVQYLKLRDRLLSGFSSAYVFTTRVKFRKSSDYNKNIPIYKLEKKDNHMARQVFARHLKQLCEDAGLNKNLVSPHVLRHSVATHLLKNGADIRIIQEFLGHADISTTQIYTHLNTEELDKTIKNYHPLAEKNWMKK